MFRCITDRSHSNRVQSLIYYTLPLANRIPIYVGLCVCLFICSLQVLNPWNRPHLNEQKGMYAMIIKRCQRSSYRVDKKKNNASHFRLAQHKCISSSLLLLLSSLYIALNLKLQTLVIRLYISCALGIQVDLTIISFLALRRSSSRSTKEEARDVLVHSKTNDTRRGALIGKYRACRKF